LGGRQQLEKYRMDYKASKASIKRMQIEHGNRIEKIFQNSEERRKLINEKHPDTLLVNSANSQQP
jgi:hypothetical protein